MRRIAHVAPLHRVVVDVFQLLAQHRLGLDDLRMASFLPELKRPVGLVPDLVILQAIEQSPHVSLAEVVDDPSCRVRLEIADLFRQVLGRGDEVDVVLEDDVAQEHHAILILEKLPGIEQDLNGFGPGEHGEPADDRAGQEVRKPRFPELDSDCVPWFVARLEKTNLVEEDEEDAGASRTAFPRGAWERVPGSTRPAFLGTAVPRGVRGRVQAKRRRRGASRTAFPRGAWERGSTRPTFPGRGWERGSTRPTFPGRGWERGSTRPTFPGRGWERGSTRSAFPGRGWERGRHSTQSLGSRDRGRRTGRPRSHAPPGAADEPGAGTSVEPGVLGIPSNRAPERPSNPESSFPRSAWECRLRRSASSSIAPVPTPTAG